MKRTALSLILLIILTTCCTNRRSRYDAVLADIDSLTEVNADSARRRLATLQEEMTRVGEGTRAYYDLLCVKADDKALVKHTSDSLISEVAHYYEAHPKSGHLPEAYYYVGRANSDMQNGEKALIYFQKALLEDSTHVTTRLKSRVFAQMGYIYLRNGLLEDAINMQQLAHFYCEQIGDTLGMRYSEEDIETIKAMKKDLHVSEYSQNEMQTKVQRLNTLVKNQILSSENSKLQSENEEKENLVWVITLSAVVVAAVLVVLLLTLRRRKKQDVPTALRFYDKDRYLVLEIGYHREPKLTGHYEPVYHIHEYSRDNFRDRPPRLFTHEDVLKYGKYLTVKGHLK